MSALSDGSVYLQILHIYYGCRDGRKETEIMSGPFDIVTAILTAVVVAVDAAEKIKDVLEEL